MRYFLLLILFPLTLSAQFYIKKDHLVIGVNFGGYIPNANTAGLYKGDVTAYNVYSIFNNANYQSEFDDFFEYDWQVDEIPLAMKYNPGLEIGFHIGKQMEKIKYYLDFNFAQLTLEDFVIIAINDPNNQSINQYTYQPIPIFGEENRTFINAGLVTNIYEEKEFHIGLPFFAQFNNTKFANNYIAVNNQSYTINHTPSNQPNTVPGGFAFGAGSGILFTFALNKQINFTAGYHAQYSKTYINTQLAPWGLQHSVFGRLVWMKE